MAGDDADRVFPQLGGHGGQAPSREALEFIEIDEEGPSFGLVRFGAAERGKRHCRDQQGT
jgi:hypothetical protein